MLWWKFAKLLMPFSKRQVSFPSNFVSFFNVMKDSSCTFLAQTIYTFLKKSPLKWIFLGLLSTQVKICQIPYVNFETTSQFLSKFCIPLQFHERQLLCAFLAQTIYTMLKRSPLKWIFFRLLSTQVKICQIPMSILKRQVNFSPNCVSFFSFMKDNSSVLF